MTETIPLLHDNHNHVSLYAAFASCRDISRTKPAEALSSLRALPRDRLSVVRGWKSFELPMTKAELSSLPPVLLINFSLHGFAVSDAGIPFVEAAVPEVASRRNDQAWCEANVPAIFDAYCGLAGIDEVKLSKYVEAMVTLGIGSTDEMTVPNAPAVDACMKYYNGERIRSWVALKTYNELDVAMQKRLSGIKLYLDGAIGARSAAIRGPWIGPGKALFTYTDELLFELLLTIGGLGTGLAMHAIGELAIEQALSTLERAAARGAAFERVRLEHVQFIERSQAERAKRLGVVLSMQPNFSSDSRDYTDRLPEAYLARNNPFRMLIDEVGFEPGRDLIFGSDGMPDGIAYAATESLFPAFPSQRLSLEELVAGYGASHGVSGTVRLDIDELERRVTVSDVRLNDPIHRRP